MPLACRRAAVALVLLAAATAARPQGRDPLPLEGLRLLAEVYQHVRRSSATPVSDEALIRAAIRGMLRDAAPEGSEFYTVHEAEEFIAGPPPGQVGIGVQLTTRGDRLVLDAPHVGGPAEAAGLQPGDVLQSIDGTAVNARTQVQAHRLLFGPAGSRVVLGLQRDCSTQPLQVTLVRQPAAAAETVVSRPTPEVVVLRPSQFRDRTLEEVARGLASEWQRGPFRGVVLDLRRNPGGLVQTAIGLAALFLPEDAVVAKSSGTDALANQLFRARPGDYLQRGTDPLASIPKAIRSLPLVVLTDEGTAAGSEIVVAALKDHRRAAIVGRRTYGRGSIQTFTRLSGGAAMKLTTAYWESPSGARIHGAGIEPDERVDPGNPQREVDAAVARLGQPR